MRRRHFLAGILGSAMTYNNMPQAQSDPASRNAAAKPYWRAPAEEGPHAATWMAWPSTQNLYGDRAYFEDVQEHLARLARAIAEFEPVFMAAPDESFALISELCGPGVTPVAIPTNDMWMRDSGPVFVTSSRRELAAVDLNFNGWGAKQNPRDFDEKVAEGVAAELSVTRLATELVGEGGGIEFDGEGTLLLTDSCWLNDNRNPGVTQEQINQEFKRLLGIEKVIWLPGVSGKDITDGHIDGSIRFVRPGLVMTGGYPGDKSEWGEVLLQSKRILTRESDARGRPFTLVDIPSATQPVNTSPDLFTGYANFYVANGAVFTPLFGDRRADALAVERLTELYPGRRVVGLEVDRIYENGGGIHCVTQQQPSTGA
ncbi:MAG: agmatine deiminase family protein [Pseudomonadota bacterium]